MGDKILITTYIDHNQKQWLADNSFKGKVIDKCKEDKTFSEHIREALNRYIESGVK